MATKVEGFFGGGPDRVNLMVLAGGSGTGKTHAMAQLGHAFPLLSNVHRLSAPLVHDCDQTFDNLRAKLSRGCGHQLLLLDDYHRADEGKTPHHKML